MKENYVAIVLGKRDIGETDRLYTFYTREEGLLSVRARGVRKGTARLAAHLEDFALVEITIAKNFGPGNLAGVISEESFSAVRTDYDLMIALARVKKIFIRLIRGSEPDTHVFDVLVSFLETLDHTLRAHRQDDAGFLVDIFLLKLYDSLGYRFPLMMCAICGTRLTEERLSFSAYSGGVLCNACAPHARDAQKILLDVDTVKVMRLAVTQDMMHMHKVRVGARSQKQLTYVTDQTEQWIMR